MHAKLVTYNSQNYAGTLGSGLPQHWSRAKLYYCCLGWLSVSFSGMAQSMALSADPKVIGLWIASTYIQFNYHKLQQLVIILLHVQTIN